MTSTVPGLRLPAAALVAGLGLACGSGADDAAPDAAAEDGAPDSVDGPDAPAWSAPENISGTAGLSDIRYQWGRSLAVGDDGTVHVAWREVSGEAATLDLAGIVYRRRAGDAWEPVQDIAAETAGAGHPKVAVSGARVWLVWHLYRPGDADWIYLSTSSAGGAPGTFSAPRAVVTDAVVTTRNPLGEYSTTPSIATDGDWVHVVWSDERFVDACGFEVPEIYLASSPDLGTTWSAPARVSSADCRSSWTPSVAAWGGTVYVAWTDERHDTVDCGLATSACREEEYVRRLPEHGMRLDEPEIRLTSDPAGREAESWGPSIVAWDRGVQVVWYDRAGGNDFEVFHLRSTDGGASWEPTPRRLSTHGPGCRSACATVAAEASVVHAVWFEICGDGSATVRHSWSNDAGVSWSGVSDVTSGSGVVAVHPHVGVHDGRVHVAWNDNADGEIYWATSP